MNKYLHTVASGCIFINTDLCHYARSLLPHNITVTSTITHSITHLNIYQLRNLRLFEIARGIWVCRGTEIHHILKPIIITTTSSSSSCSNSSSSVSSVSGASGSSSSSSISNSGCSSSSRPPLWSSGQSFWLQIQRSRVRSPALPDFLSSSGSGTGSTQPREVN